MFPYDTSLMLFWEFYSMQMPIFVRAHAKGPKDEGTLEPRLKRQQRLRAQVPAQLWHWGIFGQHTRRDLAYASGLVESREFQEIRFTLLRGGEYIPEVRPSWAT